MEETIKKVLEGLGEEIFSIKDQLKALNKLEAIEKEISDLKSSLSQRNVEINTSFIDEFVKHTTECENCRRELENALNKYYEVANIGKSGKRGKTRSNRR